MHKNLKKFEILCLLQEFEEGHAFFSELADEPAKGGHHTSNIHDVFVLGSLRLQMAAILVGFASMPRRLTRNPSFPKGTPNTHFLGLSFCRYLHRLVKVSSRLAIRESGFCVLTTMSSMSALVLQPIWSFW